MGEGRHRRLIIVEMVVEEERAAPTKLATDVVMLTLSGGRERSERQYRALLGAAGFELTSVTHTLSPLSVIEAAPRCPDHDTDSEKQIRAPEPASAPGPRPADLPGLFLSDSPQALPRHARGLSDSPRDILRAQFRAIRLLQIIPADRLRAIR